ncbi:zeta toxin family protein [Streptomyces sp. SBR177]
MGETTAAALDAEEHQDVLHRLILPPATQSAVPQEHPVVVVVSGPSGAGKTEIGDVVQAALDRRGGAVRVGRDLYKHVHRHYPALLEADVRTAGVRVRPDTIRWQAEVEEYVQAHRLDAVVKSALADAEEFRALSAAYRRSGHRIEVVAVATAEALAQLGVLDRFLAGELRYLSWEKAHRGRRHRRPVDRRRLDGGRHPGPRRARRAVARGGRTRPAPPRRLSAPRPCDRPRPPPRPRLAHRRRPRLHRRLRLGTPPPPRSRRRAATAADALAELLAALARRQDEHRSRTVERLTAVLDTGLLPAELAEMARYFLAKAHRDLGDTAASRDGMRQVAAAGGRYAPDAARGLAHLARAAGDFPTALTTAQTLGWAGRGHRVLGDIHFAHGDMTQAAAAYTAARTEAEQHGNKGEQAIAQAHLALATAFTDPARAEGEIAYAEQLLAGLDQRATTLTVQIADLVRTAAAATATSRTAPTGSGPRSPPAASPRPPSRSSSPSSSTTLPEVTKVTSTRLSIVWPN